MGPFPMVSTKAGAWVEFVVRGPVKLALRHIGKRSGLVISHHDGNIYSVTSHKAEGKERLNREAKMINVLPTRSKDTKIVIEFLTANIALDYVLFETAQSWMRESFQFRFENIRNYLKKRGPSD